jgi:hypothetical protein
MPNDQEKIRITSDEIERVIIDSPAQQASPPPVSTDIGGSHIWGRVDAGPSHSVATGASVTPNVFLHAWVYLGLAGIAGAFVAWALFEPSYYEFRATGQRGAGNFLLFPAFVMLIGLGFALAESIVEHSGRKALIRGILAVVLGIILGFVFNIIAQRVYEIGLRALYNSGSQLTGSNPLHWIVRGIAWSVFGVTGGLVYGIAGQSPKKCLYGVLGGAIGAAVGGSVFDPIWLLTHAGAPSRCLGLIIMGASTGAAIGLVESALKDRWLFVSSGPLAGKQFILYKPQTRIGRDQSNDIYLFKDTSIQSQHAVIELRGGRAVLTAAGPSFVSGQPVTQRTLQNGDLIQIGRYNFSYQEKQRPK